MILIIVLTISATSIMSAQRGDRGMRGMKADSVSRSGDHMMKMKMAPDSMKCDMMRNHMRQMGRMHNDRRFGPMSGNRRGYVNNPGSLQSIPNLTDKQKKDIADLRQKQMDEMKKFREETKTKMNEMRESYRNKVKSQLTDEQKKYFDDNHPVAAADKK